MENNIGKVRVVEQEDGLWFVAVDKLDDEERSMLNLSRQRGCEESWVQGHLRCYEKHIDNNDKPNRQNTDTG